MKRKIYAVAFVLIMIVWIIVLLLVSSNVVSVDTGLCITIPFFVAEFILMFFIDLESRRYMNRRL